MRKWRPFDQDVLFKEFLRLPKDDYMGLTYAMQAYARDQRSGYVVKSYGGGLMMVRDDSHGQGRCLFFTIREEGDREILTMLLVYKKESQEAPKKILDTARARMRTARDDDA